MNNPMSNAYICSETYCGTRMKVRRLQAKEPNHAETVLAKTVYIYRSTRLLNAFNVALLFSPQGISAINVIPRQCVWD